MGEFDDWPQESAMDEIDVPQIIIVAQTRKEAEAEYDKWMADRVKDQATGFRGLYKYARNDVQATLRLHRMEGEVGNYKELFQESVDDAVADVISARKRQAAIDAKLTIVAEFGEDVYDNGTVFRFEKRFPNSVKVYLYAVIKANDEWHTTGPKGSSYTWDQFVVWLISGDTPIRKHELTELTAGW